MTLSTARQCRTAQPGHPEERRIPLADALDPAQAGGKAANLARSAPLGFLIPEGFVVSRDVFSRFLQANNYYAVAQAVVEQYDNMDWRRRSGQFEALRSRVLALPIPGDILEEVKPGFLHLLENFPSGLAVRSSGICEDQEKASFAGVYESFLGINNLEAFWQSVIRCWCSTWSPQAAVYARKMGITMPINGMAVLVQTLIPADSSGVIFTADPAFGDPWCFVINATFGLASRLMDGTAPADRFTLAWDTQALLEKRTARKANILTIQGNCVTETILSDQKQESASLSDEQTQRIASMALAIDRGRPRPGFYRRRSSSPRDADRQRMRHTLHQPTCGRS